MRRADARLIIVTADPVSIQLIISAGTAARYASVHTYIAQAQGNRITKTIQSSRYQQLADLRHLIYLFQSSMHLLHLIDKPSAETLNLYYAVLMRIKQEAVTFWKRRAVAVEAQLCLYLPTPPFPCRMVWILDIILSPPSLALN
jgi:hypothetical protein